jgi:hypothetical protein
MTFTPPTVRQAYVKIGFICLLDYFAFLAHAFTCLSGWLKITTRWWQGYDFVDALFNMMGGSDGNDVAS